MSGQRINLSPTHPIPSSPRRKFSKSSVIIVTRFPPGLTSAQLDICDLGQAFGVTAPCFASASDATLYSLLAFTAVSSQHLGNCVNDENVRADIVARSRSAVSQIPEQDVSTNLLCGVLTWCREILSGELGTPVHLPLDGIVDLLNQCVMPFESHPMATPLYYLMLRFDLSRALADEQPLSLPLWMPLDFGQRSELATRVFHASAQALVLCGRVVNLIYGGVESTGHSESLISQWSGLVEELGSWYSSRPEESKPIVEMDGKGDSFPTVLFTTGAGLLSNQLYHTAMLLLLKNRPRTFKCVSNYKASSSMSSLWHARRICGIALANDSRGSWDPSLLASFVTAAKGMTHSAQHQMLLTRLSDIGRLTGWNVNYYWTTLRQEWGAY
ncbi:hypothetical protein jhhlp_008274 [Lomentospora prolificans]|uniref:Transcription factor domain-containing protein n=1 Tax=Lomentospora prolificans TaxID=41688 RepID=A0A2N3MXK1_9PEZI|nr:hypothetical protein jhhlp_008274 [Lomentospora prolificans]